MQNKLRCIMLVDDDEADNFIHRMVINKMNVTENIQVAENGEEAIKYLKSKSQNPPDLIFLDLNMPRINGWEFLEEYKGLELKGKEKIVIVILTTSVNPADKEKSHSFPEVQDFKIKPLTGNMLTEILDRFF